MPVFKDGCALNTIDRNGRVVQYIRVTAGPQRGKYLHQLIAEAKLGRALMPFEEVDHDNGNTLDNDPDNLIVRHSRVHARKTRATTRRRS